ncbi:MAG: carbon starvation protein A [Prevotella sp.]|nr:carbon starvation protein A [Prevotella sp.]MDY4039362.1 carbon starvation protein A [Prevotella sp.]
MISFTISLLALIVGYLIYGKFIERVFGPDDRPTPAQSMADGVDYIVLPSWKVFMIQFLNIAGTGPIFGAIMGAWYGPASYIWIVIGCIFGGAVHDYFSGMLSVRHDGANLPQLVGTYLGNRAKNVMVFFSVFLLLMVGVVFVFSPALILKDFAWSTMVWILIIFTYYILATMLPIDKIIGKFYPIFSFALLFMAVALLIVLFVKMPDLPEFWSDLDAANQNTPQTILGTTSFFSNNPLFPCLFITIACGAISGFHGTQSPLMARCLKSEKMGRPIFYGAMITEGVVALIWATVSSYFFYYGGWMEVLDAKSVNNFLAQVNNEGGKSLIQYFSAPNVVEKVCTGWLGMLGGVMAIFGVVAAPITSGDTAFRSARLIIAETLHLEQKSVANRFYIALPLFAAAVALLVWQMENPDGFNTIWQWFGWSNQTLAVFTLWTVTIYLVRQNKAFWLTLVPALFMTAVCSTYLFISKQAFGLDETLAYILGIVCLIAACVWFIIWLYRFHSKELHFYK